MSQHFFLLWAFAPFHLHPFIAPDLLILDYLLLIFYSLKFKHLRSFSGRKVEQSKNILLPVETMFSFTLQMVWAEINCVSRPQCPYLLLPDISRRSSRLSLLDLYSALFFFQMWLYRISTSLNFEREQTDVQLKLWCDHKKNRSKILV